MKSARRAPFVESLENRRFLSATVHPAILGPSAVEGNYVGTASYEGMTKEIKLSITSTSVTLTVVGVGSKTVKLTTKEFNAIRKGSIDESGNYDGYSYTVDGAFNSTGTRIDGTATVGTGSMAITGTAALRKV